MEKTIAERVSELLGDDGTDFSRWDEVVEQFWHRVERLPGSGLVRYEFEDGSAIVAGVGGWDIEGPTPFSWAGCPECEEE